MSAAAKGAGRDAELHTLTGAYALNALGDRERARFERHLAVCQACAQEVRELGATAVRLGLAATEIPPSAMKSQVMARISAVRQEPPKVAAAEAGRIPPPVHRARPAGRRRLAGFVLAACVAGLAALGGVAVVQQRAADEARVEARAAVELAQQHTQALADVLTAPDVRTRSTALGQGATGTVAFSRERDRAVFLASGLPRPDDGRVYQLWFADDGTMRPAGLLASTGSAEALLMDGGVGRATGMGITVEPAGGSTAPTSEPLGLLSFSAR
ncbi:anti-sigma factor [Streptomyces sp. ICN441]|uniref:Regulator of SigK n=1 Tax=Streptomyces tirandamycinicus TaxID=2174846 RepID=A0A2S1SMY2_9ACTN|nr:MULTISPECIES: anti-sigma factor [Streptomyces]AWI27712.1 anti-sigma factor [Streptomyces tirandamycinicus]TFE38766.1 anti-sigma factor [Streptomyces sp. ICN441]